MLPCSITGYLCMHKHAADARQPDLACHSCWHGIQADSAMAGLSWGNSVQPFGFLPQHGFNADSGPFRWQNASGSWCQGMSRSLFMQCIANLSAHASGKRFEIMGNTWCYKAWLVMVCQNAKILCLTHVKRNLQCYLHHQMLDCPARFRCSAA